MNSAFIIEGGIRYANATFNGVPATVVVAEINNSTIRLYYERVKHLTTISSNGGYKVSDKSTEDVVVERYYGSTFNIEERQKNGFILVGYTLTPTSGEGLATGTVTFNEETKTGTWTVGLQDETLTMVWQEVLNNITVNWNLPQGSPDTAFNGLTYQTTWSTDYNYLPYGKDILGYDFAGWSMTEEEIKSAIALGQDVTVVATGGNAPVIVRYCRNPIIYDKYLLMEGLWTIYQKNK